MADSTNTRKNTAPLLRIVKRAEMSAGKVALLSAVGLLAGIVVGESQNTARYAGMNVSKIVLRTMFISGAICGLAGMVQVSGNTYNLSDGIAGGVGFTAIIVAWLARLNPFVIVVITALFSILEKGSSVMQSAFGLSSAVSDILQGIILFVVLAVDFFTRYALVIRGGKEEQA